MKLSISQRLAAMFAAASFVMLAVLGVAMHGLLKRELARHQVNELQARWQMHQSIIAKNSGADHWHIVQGKFDGALPENGLDEGQDGIRLRKHRGARKPLQPTIRGPRSGGPLRPCTRD